MVLLICRYIGTEGLIVCVGPSGQKKTSLALCRHVLVHACHSKQQTVASEGKPPCWS